VGALLRGGLDAALEAARNPDDWSFRITMAGFTVLLILLMTSLVIRDSRSDKTAARSTRRTPAQAPAQAARTVIDRRAQLAFVFPEPAVARRESEWRVGFASI
jgi:hypothetical protein